MPALYPYPKLEEDGYELEVVEQADAKNHPFLKYPYQTTELDTP